MSTDKYGNTTNDDGSTTTGMSVENGESYHTEGGTDGTTTDQTVTTDSNGATVQTDTTNADGTTHDTTASPGGSTEWPDSTGIASQDTDTSTEDTTSAHNDVDENGQTAGSTETTSGSVTNEDGSTTTGSSVEGGESYHTEGGPDGSSSDQTVTTDSNGGTTVQTDTNNGDGTTTDVTAGPSGSTSWTDSGGYSNQNVDTSEADTTDAHNANDPTGQSPAPPPSDDDSSTTGSDDNSTDSSDTTPHEGEEESSDNSAEMSGGDSMSGDPGMDSEHASLPPGIIDVMTDAIKNMHQPSHGGDNINVTDSTDTGIAVAGDVAAPVGEHQVSNTPMDPAGPHGDLGDGAPGGGNIGSVGPGSGNGNIINDIDEGTQSNGPEERNTSHDMKINVPSSGGGTEIGLPGPQTLPPSAGNHNDSHSISNVGKPVETNAQHLAQELKDALAQQHDQAPHDVLKDAADKIAVTVHAAVPLVHGVSFDDGNHLADFIKAAQTPVQSGLMASLQPAGSAVLHHDTAASGLSHEVGSVDLHATVALHAAPVAVLHDSAVEHHAAPVSVEALWHH